MIFVFSSDFLKNPSHRNGWIVLGLAIFWVFSVDDLNSLEDENRIRFGLSLSFKSIQQKAYRDFLRLFK